MLILCSGKVYYNLLKAKEDHNIDNVIIARMEMLYPFPDKDVSQYLKRFKKVKDVVWCQEEPRNMGSWQYIAPRIQELLQRGQKLSYVGRQASASPAEIGRASCRDRVQIGGQ